MKLVPIKSSCCAASYEGVHLSKSHVKANRTRSNVGEQYNYWESGKGSLRFKAFIIYKSKQ